MSDKLPDEQTRAQLETLGYSGSQLLHSRPVLVCDVDEVVLHLVGPFEKVLKERGFGLKTHTFKLTGNVYEMETGREATEGEVWAGLHQLFEEQDKRQGLVDGVLEGLARIANNIDIIFLTNMPHPYRETRRDYLVDKGFDYPLVTNSGSKVPAIKIIQENCSHPVGFIDDGPVNLNQVREGVVDVHLFHFMADQKFRELAGEIKGVLCSTGDWEEASGAIIRKLMENPDGEH